MKDNFITSIHNYRLPAKAPVGPEAVVDLIISEITDSYISVADITAGRVDDHTEENAELDLRMKPMGDFKEVLTDEISFTMFADQSKEESEKFLVLGCLDDQLAGFAIFTINPVDGSDEKFANLEDILVGKHFQQKGYATKILHTMEAFLKEESVAFAILESSLKNHNTHLFVEKEGFKKVSYSYYKRL